jgi:hypothetical protein
VLEFAEALWKSLAAAPPPRQGFTSVNALTTLLTTESLLFAALNVALSLTTPVEGGGANDGGQRRRRGLRVHGMDNLFVCDGSVLPLSPGVDPQVSIMALTRLGAEAISPHTASRSPKRHRFNAGQDGGSNGDAVR